MNTLDFLEWLAVQIILCIQNAIRSSENCVYEASLYFKDSKFLGPD
jgi:hypothetical protein